MKGRFIEANPRDSKSLMVVHRDEGSLHSDEPYRMLKFRLLFAATKACIAAVNLFPTTKGFLVAGNP